MLRSFAHPFIRILIRLATYFTAEEGQIVFVSSDGDLDSSPSFSYDQSTKTLKMNGFSADSFQGDSINFRGREIRNVHLVDSSIENLQHLTLSSLALSTQTEGLAVVGKDGKVLSSRHMQFDENTMELKLPSLSSFSKTGLEIRSDVDFTDHVLKNIKLETNATLENVIVKTSYIENALLHNCTTTNLNLGDVSLDSLSVSQFDSTAIVGSLLVAGEGGVIEATPVIKQDKEGSLSIDGKVTLTKSLDLNDQDIHNAKLISGSINGNIDVSVDSIKAKSISLSDITEDKTVTSDGLAVLGLDGRLKMGPILIDKESGSVGDFKVHGTVDFTRQGKIKDALVMGGTVDGLEKLSVSGETELGSGLQVVGETYLDGSLTVSGSVLGSGPYVDVSDKRFKKNIKRMDSASILNKLCQVNGVSYELDLKRLGQQHTRLGGGLKNDHQDAQFGFVAQDVEELFPEIVSSIDGEEDYLGVQYSRFAPLLVEGLKQLTKEVRNLQEERDGIMNRLKVLEQRLTTLEEK